MHPTSETNLPLSQNTKTHVESGSIFAWAIALFPVLLAIVFPVMAAIKEELAMVVLSLYANAIILKKLFSQTCSVKSSKLWKPLQISLLLFTFWMGVATIFSKSPSESFSFYIKFLLFLLSGWACAIAFKNPLFQRSGFFWLIAFNGCVWGFWAIIEYFLARRIPLTWLDPSIYKLIPTRTTGIFTDPNIFGLYLGGLLPFIAGGYWDNFEKGRLPRFFFCIAFVLVGIGLMTTFSRGSGIAAIIGLIVILLILRKKIRSHPGNKAVVFCVVILVVIALLSPFRHRLLPPVTTKGDFAVAQRKAIFQGLNKAREVLPLYGFGPDSFAQAYQKFRPFGGEYPLHAHNEFAQTWFETGFPGVFLLFLITLLAATQLIKTIRSPDQKLSLQEYAGLSLFIAGFTQNMSGFSLRMMPTACLLSIGVGAFLNSFAEDNKINKGNLSCAVKGFICTLALAFFILTSREATIQDWVVTGKSLLEKGQYAKAVEMGRKIVSLSPGSFQGNYILGRSYKDLKQFDLAHKFLDSAIESNSISAEVWEEKARLAEAQGLDSVVWWENALMVDPCDFLLGLLLARALSNSGRKSDAIRAVEESLSRCSPFPEIFRAESDALNDYLKKLKE
jgi:O-antigen ligase